MAHFTQIPFSGIFPAPKGINSFLAAHVNPELMGMAGENSTNFSLCEMVAQTRVVGIISKHKTYRIETDSRSDEISNEPYLLYGEDRN